MMNRIFRGKLIAVKTYTGSLLVNIPSICIYVEVLDVPLQGDVQLSIHMEERQFPQTMLDVEHWLSP